MRVDRISFSIAPFRRIISRMALLFPTIQMRPYLFPRLIRLFDIRRTGTHPVRPTGTRLDLSPVLFSSVESGVSPAKFFLDDSRAKLGSYLRNRLVSAAAGSLIRLPGFLSSFVLDGGFSRLADSVRSPI